MESDDKPRTPLIWHGEKWRLEELQRRCDLQDWCLDSTLLPINTTDAERRAALIPGVDYMENTPAVSAKLAGIAAAIGAILGFAASAASGVDSLPAWLPFSLSLLSGIALFLAGKAIPPLKITEGKPIVPIALVPFLKAAAVAVGTFAGTLAPGHLQGGLLLLASALYGLAGLIAPQEMLPKP